MACESVSIGYIEDFVLKHKQQQKSKLQEN